MNRGNKKVHALIYLMFNTLILWVTIVFHFNNIFNVIVEVSSITTRKLTDCDRYFGRKNRYIGRKGHLRLIFATDFSVV